MTILAKTSIVIKKPDGIKLPLVIDEVHDEEKVDIYPEPAPPKKSRHRHRQPQSASALLCMSVLAVSVAVAGVTCGLMLYRQYLRSVTVVRRYQGFCSIPIQPDMIQSGQLIEPKYREHAVMPLQWSSTPDVQMFTADDAARARDVAGALREEFDVNARVETIRVYDNGRTISFMHDFDDNVTGIVDNDRCFMMDLDPALVLTPDMLVFGIEHGDEFDVSRVHSTVRAVLPALEQLARVMVERCRGKPAYRLQKVDEPAIRKRSTDSQPHDYIHFAGKHVQEIEISNLADLLQYEQDNK